MNLQAEHLNPIVLNTGLAVHDADWNWRNVNSPFTRLYCVTEGAAQVQLDDGLHDLTPGHLYIVPAFCRHTDICHGHFVHYYLHLYEDSRMDENRLEQFDFPFETVLEIGDYGFAEACFFMNGPIELPVLERLGAYAFLSCTFAFINTDSYLFFQALTEMGEGVFYDAYGITEVDFRISPLEEIPPNAFRDSSLSDVSLPSGLKSIGYSAFGNCGNLTSISDFPIGVVSIGDFAFYNCGLYEVALREGLASIGVYAFANNNLTYISIPASVVAIAAHAFSNNDLSSVYFDGDCQNIYIDHEAFDLFYIEEGEVNIKDELSDGV